MTALTSLHVILAIVNIALVLYANKHTPAVQTHKIIDKLNNDLIKFAVGNYSIVALMCGSPHKCHWQAFHSYTEMSRLSYFTGVTLCTRTLDEAPLLTVLNKLCNAQNVCRNYTAVAPLGIPMGYC